MALHEGLEIYIPLQAEVKCIALNSLPSSVLRAMGISQDQVTQSTDSSECLWICPAHIQRKGQQQSSVAQGRAREDMLKALGVSRGVRAGSAKLKMSFVTANCTAYRVLKDTLSLFSHRQTCCSEKFSRATLAYNKQDAIIVHGGHIYLSVRKCRKKDTPVPQPAALLSPDTLDLTMDNKELPVINKPLKRKRTPSPAPLLSPSQQAFCKEQEQSQSLDLCLLHSGPRGSSEPSALQQDFEFEELAHREKIAQMNARLSHINQVFSNLQPTNK